MLILRNADASVHHVNVDLNGSVDDRLGIRLIEQIHKDLAVLQGDAGIGGHRIAVDKAAVGGRDIQQGAVRDDAGIDSHRAVAQPQPRRTLAALGIIAGRLAGEDFLVRAGGIGGAVRPDMNMQIAWLNSGTDAELEWQWDGGHVPSEIFGESLALYIDEMYGKYVEGAAEVTKAEAQTQTQNGTATEATGTDISSWASYEDGETNFTLADAASYRIKGASKATPGFDVIDYGQETYEFGSTTQDARHFDRYVLKVLQEEKETLKGLFNSNND